MFCLYIYPPPATGCVFTEIRGYFHTKHHKNSRLPRLSVTVHPLCSRGGYQLSPLSPGPRPWAVSEPLHPFLLGTQPVTSATLAVTHHRYPRDRLHENITQCDRFQEMKSGAEVRTRVTGVRTDPSRCELCHLDFRVWYNIGTILSLSADYNLLKTDLSDTEEAGGDRFNYRPQGPYCEQRSWNIKYLHLSVLYFHHFLFSALLWWAGGVSELGC